VRPEGNVEGADNLPIANGGDPVDYITVLPIAKVLQILGEALELLALPYKLPVENSHLPPIYRSRMPEIYPDDKKDPLLALLLIFRDRKLWC
jgi:hypothetical protein